MINHHSNREQTLVLWGGGGGGGGVFHLHPVTPLSLKSDDSNFVQTYFGVGSVFWGEKNWDQIDNDITMTSSMFW